jgi:hypothetical protein
MKILFTNPATAGRGVPGELADHARRRLRMRLHRWGERIAHVSVRFGSTVARSARQDAYCVVQVQLRGAPAATVMHIGADAFGAIDRAVDRIGRLAEEQLRVATDAPPPPTGARGLVA